LLGKKHNTTNINLQLKTTHVDILASRNQNVFSNIFSQSQNFLKCPTVIFRLGYQL